MDEQYLKEEYFAWIVSLVGGRGHLKLLHKLDETDFFYVMPMDANREDDGIELRYRFGYECRYDDTVIARGLDNRPCSVLEMMAALALRIEENIMDDPDEGDRLKNWFWSMVESLGLAEMDDENFDAKTVEKHLDIFMNRKYRRNGAGGLFTLKFPPRDMRTVEIWYQMCWYLDEFIGGNER